MPVSSAGRRRVLVVDDEASVRDILCDALDAFDYDAISAENAVTAMKKLESEDVDLVLSDIEMPGENGMQLLSRIKKSRPTLDVVMVTGVVDAQVAVQAIRNGASDYVTKPFNLEEVQIVVDRVLEKRRLVKENEAYQEHLEELVALRTDEVKQLYATLEESYESTLQALVTALDFRDNETQGHSFRVVEYAVMVAERMGVHGDELTWIRRGSILHDVGKIGVPDAILRKPGKLDAEEWEVMKQHPELGHEMLRHIRFLAPALDIVRSHQERFDGTGYPDGLKGEAIPLGARIFAVVDTFDAMTSDRPYRKALSIKAAADEILRCAGKQFDPKVAEAFLSIPAERWREVRERVHREVAEKKQFAYEV